MYKRQDLGIVFGTAFRQALGEAPVARYGQSYVPMDECLCRSVLDISGRPYLVFHADFENQSIGALDVCMVEEFFYAFTYTSRTTLHLEVLYGKNDHHKVEGLFKACLLYTSHSRNRMHLLPQSDDAVPLT